MQLSSGFWGFGFAKEGQFHASTSESVEFMNGSNSFTKPSLSRSYGISEISIEGFPSKLSGEIGAPRSVSFQSQTKS